MVVPITNDLIVAAVAAVVLLGIQKVANAKSSEWLLYIVSLVFAILLFYFETIPRKLSNLIIIIDRIFWNNRIQLLPVLWLLSIEYGEQVLL